MAPFDAGRGLPRPTPSLPAPGGSAREGAAAFRDRTDPCLGVAWNNFLWPKVILVNNDYQTMPMLISNIRAGYVTDYGMLMLAVLLASLPAVVIFLILQRSFANGITGAIE